MIVREQMRPGDRQSEEVLLRNREKIARGLDALETAARRASCSTAARSTSPISPPAAPGYLNFRRVLPNWCVNRPALVKLAETLFERESFARTVPPTH